VRLRFLGARQPLRARRQPNILGDGYAAG
jgi:hypothetical protein